MNDPTLSTTTEEVSPVTLNADWSPVGRLLLITALTVCGSIGNIFLISAVMIEDHLRQKGNSFIVNVALADLLITGVVFPASVIALLSGAKDTSQTVCTAQWCLAQISCFVCLLSMAAASVENYARLCLPACYSCLSPCIIIMVVLSIWVASGTTAAVQTFLHLGPDYCERTSQGLVPYQISIGAVLVVTPVVIIISCHILLWSRIRSARAAHSYRSQVALVTDYDIVKTNACAFIVFIIFWMPFGGTLIFGPIHIVSRRTFYNLAWFALSKSCINNLVYCATNRYFRSAYVNLFHYCCCKTTVSFSRRAREPPVRTSGDVRVHIIPAYNMNYSSPARTREAGKNSGKRLITNRPSGRDVYEL